MPDILRGAFSGTGADQVAEIVGREAKLPGAIADGGDALQILPALGIITFQDVVYFPAKIIRSGAGSFELAFVETGGKLEQERNVRQDDTPQMRVVRILDEFFADSGDAQFP